MQRIDSINARPNENGIGKAGFNDNADLPGQDATYLTPTWLNTIQEEICNLLEKNNVNLDPSKKDQLFNLLVTYPYIQALELAIEDRFILSTLSNKKLFDELQSQITALVNRVVYPRIIASGIIYYVGGDAGGSLSLLSGTDGWNVSNDKVVAPQIYNLSDRNFGIFLSPESENESFSLERGIQDFKPKVWNRSGTNRIGYTGQVGFQVIQHKNPNSVSIDGDYPTGIYSFILQPSESKLFTLIGAGGGGGSSIKSSESIYPLADGRAGEDVILKVNGQTIAIVHGGGGGSQGIWGNGSAFSNGNTGELGDIEIIGVFDSTNVTLGKSDQASRENHKGGESVSPIGMFGKGGDGANGIGDEGWSYGGGGASGSVLVAKYTNNSTSNQTITLIIGKGGRGGEKGWSANDIVGSNGSDGFARVVTSSN